MAKYMSFDFSDGECSHRPVVVRIDKDLTFQQLTDIDKAIQHKMDEYVEEGEYWDTDESLIDDVMKEFSNNFVFDYEIISIDYESVC